MAEGKNGFDGDNKKAENLEPVKSGESPEQEKSGGNPGPESEEGRKEKGWTPARRTEERLFFFG